MLTAADKPSTTTDTSTNYSTFASFGWKSYYFTTSKASDPHSDSSESEEVLCFNYDDKFIPGHKCSPTPLHTHSSCLMVDPGDDSILELNQPHAIEILDNPLAIYHGGDLGIHTQGDYGVDPSPCISFHALMEQLVPSTLKLAVPINRHKITVLIDGGSTNNFI